MPAGYANEVGEAFRALVPVSLVWGSYAVATAYVTADAVDKGKKAAVVRVGQISILFFFFGESGLNEYSAKITGSLKGDQGPLKRSQDESSGS